MYVRRRLGIDGEAERPIAATRQLVANLLENDHARPVARQACRMRGGRDEQVERRVADHELETRDGIVWTGRADRAARLQRAEDGDDHLDGTIDRDPDTPLTPEAARAD